MPGTGGFKSVAKATFSGNPIGAAKSLEDAIGAISRELQDLAGTFTQFVQALAPAVVLDLNQAFRDLQATIGVAFTGAVQVVSSFVREVSGVLLPVMRQLEPIFRTLTDAMGTYLIAGVRLFASLMETITPVLQIAVDLLNQYVKFMYDLNAIVVAFIKTLTETVFGFLGRDTSGWKETFKGFFDVIRQVTRAMVTLAATIAAAAGAEKFVADFGLALEKEAKDREARVSGAKAAATNPGISDVASILQRAQLSAFTAQGTGAAREKTDVELLRELSRDLKAIAADRRPLSEQLASWWDEKVVGGSGILGQVLRFINGIQDRIRKFLDKFGA